MYLYKNYPKKWRKRIYIQRKHLEFNFVSEILERR